MGGPRHWHVTVTVTGVSMEPLMVRQALLRLAEERPFLDTVGFSADTAEIAFWDQGESMVDIASLALRMWSEHRVSAGLPDWEVVGLEVVEKTVREARESDAAPALESVEGPFALL